MSDDQAHTILEKLRDLERRLRRLEYFAWTAAGGLAVLAFFLNG